MEITLRSYSEEDSIDEIFDIHDKALKAIGCIPLVRAWNNDLYDITGNYIMQGGDFIMVETSNKIVGFGALKRLGKGVYEIKRMRIAPEWQGKGIGQMLLRRLLSVAIEKGADKVVLDTTTQQTHAQKLYEKFGFRKCGTANSHGFDVIMYELIVHDYQGNSSC